MFPLQNRKAPHALEFFVMVPLSRSAKAFNWAKKRRLDSRLMEKEAIRRRILGRKKKAKIPSSVEIDCPNRRDEDAVISAG